MAVDIGALVIILTMGYGGRVTGSAFQMVRLVVLLLAALLGYVISHEAARFHLGLSPELHAMDAASLWFFICTGVLWGVGTLVAGRLAGGARDASISREVGDQVGGFLLGAARGFAIAALLVMGMYAQYQTHDRFKLDYPGSQLAKLAVPNSLIAKQTVKLKAHLDEHYTTDEPDEESNVRRVGDIPNEGPALR